MSPMTRKTLLKSVGTTALAATLGATLIPAATAAPATRTVAFIDVNSSTPYQTEITWLQNQGITTGWADGTFRPHDETQRAAAAAFLYRAAGSPAFTAPTQPSFKDVPTTHPFYKEIEWMKAEGITTGWADGTFRPDEGVQRGAMAAFLYRAAGSPQYTAPKRSPFTDLKPTDAFYKEISWLKAEGIATGWADGTFRAGDSTERAAAAAFIYRAYH